MTNFGTLRTYSCALALALTLAGCGTTFAMTPDASVPFAKGEIDASFVKGGNGKFVVRVEHLGPPAKLNPSATVYIVWLKPKNDKGDQKATNTGALKVDDNFAGELEFMTPFASFDVAITPETAADVTEPAGRDILKTTVGG